MESYGRMSDLTESSFQLDPEFDVEALEARLDAEAREAEAEAEAEEESGEDKTAGYAEGGAFFVKNVERLAEEGAEDVEGLAEEEAKDVEGLAKEQAKVVEAVTAEDEEDEEDDTTAVEMTIDEEQKYESQVLELLGQLAHRSILNMATEETISCLRLLCSIAAKKVLTLTVIPIP